MINLIKWARTCVILPCFVFACPTEPILSSTYTSDPCLYRSCHNVVVVCCLLLLLCPAPAQRFLSWLAGVACSWEMSAVHIVGSVFLFFPRFARTDGGCFVGYTGLLFLSLFSLFFLVLKIGAPKKQNKPTRGKSRIIVKSPRVCGLLALSGFGGVFCEGGILLYTTWPGSSGSLLFIIGNRNGDVLS